MTRSTGSLLRLVVVAPLLTACAWDADIGSRTQAVEGVWGCSDTDNDGNLIFVAEDPDGDDCEEATLLAYPVDPRTDSVKLIGGNAGNAGNSNHAAAVQNKTTKLTAAGTTLLLPHKERTKQVKYEGKLTSEVGIKMSNPKLLGPVSATYKVGSTTEADVTFDVKESMTLFTSDPHEIGPLIDRFVEDDCGGWKTDGQWLVAHSHITIWHTTSLSDGAAAADGVLRKLAIEMGPGELPIGPVGSVEDSATLTWKTTTDGTWAVRRIFPLPASKVPPAAEDGDDEIESAPSVSQFPWTAHGIARNLLSPALGEPVQCRRGRAGHDGESFPMYFRDPDGKLLPLLCYEANPYFRQIFDNLNPVPATNVNSAEIAGLLLPGQRYYLGARADRSKLGEIKIKSSMWDRIPVLDSNLKPSDFVNVKGQKVDAPACGQQLPRCDSDSGLAPYFDPATNNCTCVPSVGHKARESFAKYAIPFLEFAASDGGAFGFRKIPDYVAKRADDNSAGIIDVLHTCWCDLWLKDTTSVATGAHGGISTTRKYTGHDILLVPPKSYRGFCHQLNDKRSPGDTTWGIGYSSYRMIEYKDCIRAEIPWNLPDGTNNNLNLPALPKSAGFGNGWKFVNGPPKGIPAIGRRWRGNIEDQVTFLGKVGSQRGAGKWQTSVKGRISLVDPRPYGWLHWGYK